MTPADRPVRPPVAPLSGDARADAALVLSWEDEPLALLPDDRPTLVRLDGIGFTKWTRCCDRPWDPRLHDLMARTAVALAHLLGASYVYTQSDEMTLVVPPSRPGMAYLGGRVRKLASTLASKATALFNAATAAEGLLPREPACFDARPFSVPDREGAALAVMVRELDAVRNSVSIAAREHFSHASLQGASGPEMRARLAEAGRPWGSLPEGRRVGSAFARRVAPRSFTPDEIARLAPTHPARKDPAFVVARGTWVRVPMPLRWGCANAAAVIFDGAEPERAWAEANVDEA